MFFAVIVLMPVYVLLVTSFKGLGGDQCRQPCLDPAAPCGPWIPGRGLDAPPDLLHTFGSPIPVAIIPPVLGSLTGFVLARWRFPGADVVFTLILFGMFIPYQAVMIPLT